MVLVWLRGNIHLSNGDVASLQESEYRHTSSSLGVAVIPNPNFFTCGYLSLSTYLYLIVLAFTHTRVTCLSCLVLSITLAIVRLTFIFRIIA